MERPPTQELKTQESPPISRRSFLKAIGAVTIAAGLSPLLTHESPDLVNSDQESDLPGKFHDPPDKFDLAGLAQETEKALADTNLDTPEAYWETSLQQGLMTCAKEIAQVIFTELGITQGNQAWTREKFLKAIQEKPLSNLLMLTALGPVVEETIFRLLPSRYLQHNTTPRWGAGIGISAIFALMHNLDKTKEQDEWLGKIDFIESVPITQFMGGLFYWYLMEEKGFSHAVLAHGLNNIYATVGMGLSELFKSKEEENTQAPKHHWGGKRHRIANLELPFQLIGLKKPQ